MVRASSSYWYTSFIGAVYYANSLAKFGTVGQILQIRHRFNIYASKLCCFGAMSRWWELGTANSLHASA